MPEQHGWLKRAQELWRDLARPVDYPQDDSEWRALIEHPVALSGPFDWGVAIGSAVTDRGSRRSPLGSLLWSFKHRDDDRAVEILAAVLVRFLEHLDVKKEYDGIIPVPPSFRSRPGPPVESLLTNADHPLPLPVWSKVVRRTVAVAPHRDDGEARPQAARDDTLFEIDALVTGKRILLIDDFYNTGETINALVHALREQNAARVGVVVICSTPRRNYD